MEEVNGLETAIDDMGLHLDSNPSTPFVSAPTSPTRLSFNEFGSFSAVELENLWYHPSPISTFYDTPASSTRELAASSFASGYDSDTIEFEFEATRGLQNPMYQHQPLQQQRRRQQKIAPCPMMSSPEEPSSNGQILPLKPPPCLQYASTRNSGLSSPTRSPSSVPCTPFPVLNFKNNDFDPFMVALDNVRKEKMKRTQLTPLHSRTISFSQERSTWGDPTNRIQHQNKKVDQPIMPRKSGSERFIRPIGLDLENQLKPKSLKTLDNEATTNKDDPSTKVPRPWRSFPKCSRRRMIGDLISFRSASAGRADAGDKLRDHTDAIKITNDVRISRFKPTCGTSFIKKSERAREDMKAAIVPHKPCLLVCFGFTSKGITKNKN